MEDRPDFGSYVALNALRIGIVDDSSYFRKLLRTILAAYGIRQIYEAGTQDDAWQMILQQRPDILLLDWQLGTGGNGGDLVNDVRSNADPQISTLAIVLVSAYSDKRHVMEAVKRGANDFIVKPVSAKLVYERLKRLTTTRIVYQRVGSRLVPVMNPPQAKKLVQAEVIPVGTRGGPVAFL